MGHRLQVADVAIDHAEESEDGGLVGGDAVEIADVDLLRMSIRIVGAIGWLATGSNADPVQPRLDQAAFPYSASSLLGFALNRVVSSMRVLRPIHG